MAADRPVLSATALSDVTQSARRRATISRMSSRARLPLDLSLAQSASPRRWMPALAAGLSIGEYARSLARRLAFLSSVLVTAIWALSGQGYFWPAWVWLGLGDLVLLDFSASWAWRQPRRRAPTRTRPGGRRRAADATPSWR
jgi:hypothetical protein